MNDETRLPATSVRRAAMLIARRAKALGYTAEDESDFWNKNFSVFLLDSDVLAPGIRPIDALIHSADEELVVEMRGCLKGFILGVHAQWMAQEGERVDSS